MGMNLEKTAENLSKRYSKIPDSKLGFEYLQYIENNKGKNFDVQHYGGFLGIVLADEVERRRGNKTIERWVGESMLSENEKKACEFYKVMNQKDLTPYHSAPSNLKRIIQNIYGYHKLQKSSGKNLKKHDEYYLRGFVKDKYNQGRSIAIKLKVIPNK